MTAARDERRSALSPVIRRLLVPLLMLPFLSGCLSSTTTVALFVADSEGGSVVDVDAFTEQVREVCDECEVKVYPANGDAGRQREQVADAVDNDAAILVVQPVAADDAESHPSDGLPVVSLIELVPGSDRFVGLAEPIPADVAAQGDDLVAAREVITGDRKTMTYVPGRAMSEQAALVALSVLGNDPLDGSEDYEGVQSWLYETSRVTRANLATVLVGQGTYTLDELCSGHAKRPCEALGLI